MIRYTLSLLATWAIFTSVGVAQPAAAKKTAVGDIELTFANGSVVKMTLLPDDIEIITPYGTLTVPAREIRRIDFGSHLSEATDQKIQAAIKNLASMQIKDRDEAVRELVALGAHAYPALLQAARTGDAETTKRAREALAQIKAKVPAKDLKLTDDDKIVTARFTILGRITTNSIKAKSEYFKDDEHPLAKLRTLRSLGSGSEYEVAVEATKFALQTRVWMDTGISLDGAGPLIITATGQVELRPMFPGNFVCGPSGLNRFKGKKGGGIAQIYPGTLLGRIGETGEAFVIGDRFEGPLERNGKLYLQIMQSPYDAMPTGSYQVKVRAGD